MELLSHVFFFYFLVGGELRRSSVFQSFIWSTDREMWGRERVRERESFTGSRRKKEGFEHASEIGSLSSNFKSESVKSCERYTTTPLTSALYASPGFRYLTCYFCFLLLYFCLLSVLTMTTPLQGPLCWAAVGQWLWWFRAFRLHPSKLFGL